MRSVTRRQLFCHWDKEFKGGRRQRFRGLCRCLGPVELDGVWWLAWRPIRILSMWVRLEPIIAPREARPGRRVRMVHDAYQLNPDYEHPLTWQEAKRAKYA